MALQVSTGLRTAMLGSNPLTTVLNLGKILIYTGTPPTTADAAPTGTLLCTITNNSTATGITFATASAGTIAKNGSETWSGVNSSTGTAGYYRHVSSTDTGALSTTDCRLQGVVSTAGAEMNLSNTALTSGATQTVDYYVVSLPTF